MKVKKVFRKSLSPNFATLTYYFINKETRKPVIAIVYINNICFIGSKNSLLLLESKQKFITIGMS